MDHFHSNAGPAANASEYKCIHAVPPTHNWSTTTHLTRVSRQLCEVLQKQGASSRFLTCPCFYLSAQILLDVVRKHGIRGGFSGSSHRDNTCKACPCKKPDAQFYLQTKNLRQRSATRLEKKTRSLKSRDGCLCFLMWKDVAALQAQLTTGGSHTNRHMALKKESLSSLRFCGTIACKHSQPQVPFSPTPA